MDRVEGNGGEVGKLDRWQMWFGVSEWWLVVLEGRKEWVCRWEVSVRVVLGLAVLGVFLGVPQIGEVEAESIQIPLQTRVADGRGRVVFEAWVSDK